MAHDRGGPGGGAGDGQRAQESAHTVIDTRSPVSPPAPAAPLRPEIDAAAIASTFPGTPSDVAAAMKRTQVGAGSVAPRPPSHQGLGSGRAAEPASVPTSSQPRVSAPPAPAAPSGELELHAGDRVHQYEVIRELGRGGMGRVLLARDTTLGRRVCLKFLISNSRHFTERFLIEAQTTAQVNHENIVIIHEVGTFQNAPYMVLEYLEGKPLSDTVEGRTLSSSRVVELMVPVVRALVRAHEHGIVHRDLKPDNVFVTSSGQIKVLDFGIAKILSGGGQPAHAGVDVARAHPGAKMGLTQQGAIMGTMPYMSPEQWGQGVIDHRTDIYAVGIMMFEMLAGRHPISPLTPERLVYEAATPDAPLPSVADFVPELPLELVAIVDRCLRKDKSKRFATAAELLDALEPLLPGRFGRKLREGESPYPGLAAFQEADADRFFGRSKDISRVVKKIRERPLLALVGPSGVGKSSLVRAGLVPALKASEGDWESLVIRPGRDPIASLASLLQPMTRTSSTRVDDAIEEHRRLVARIRREPGYVGSLLRARARERDSKTLLYVDQFEELYTLVPDLDERNAFVSVLAGIADDATSPLRVVLSMRSDFLDRVGENDRFLDELTQGLIFLQSPDREGLREALTLPVEMVGYQFESQGLVEEMLGALSNTPGALPLLQFCAAKLWDERDRGRQLLTRDAYERMGGIAGTLATHANDVVAGLTSAQQRLLREIFLRLVTPEGTRAIIDVAELQQIGSAPAEVERLVQLLVQSRLLTIQTRSEAEGPAVEIVHESLITKWPMLRLWLDEGQEDSAFLEQLRTTAKQWERGGRPVGLLWRGDAMDEAKRFNRRFKGELAARERDYLDAVLRLATRSGRIKRFAVVGTIIFLSGLVVAGAIALIAIRDAEKEAVDQARIANEEMKRAKSAEQKIREQLDIIQQKDKAKLAAESQAKAAEEQKAVAEEKAAKGQETIAMTKEQLQEALVKAEKLRRVAEAESAKAEKEAERANAAADKEREAKKNLARLLAEKQKELEELKKQRTKIKTTLD